MNLTPEWIRMLAKYDTQFRTQDLLPANLETLVIEVLQKFEPQLNLGALITIDVNRSKVRILPIESKK